MIVTTLIITCAGGLGASLRLILNRVIHTAISSTYPVAMSLINITGSFFFGLVSGVLDARLLPPEWGLYLAVGLVGGFTAFSTTSFQTLRLIQERRYLIAAINSFGMITVAVTAAGVGVWIGRLL